MHSAQIGDPRKWATSSRHHLQISYSRDSVSNVTYPSAGLLVPKLLSERPRHVSLTVCRRQLIR
jgi:hypothetical protein